MVVPADAIGQDAARLDVHYHTPDSQRRTVRVDLKEGPTGTVKRRGALAAVGFPRKADEVASLELDVDDHDEPDDDNLLFFPRTAGRFALLDRAVYLWDARENEVGLPVFEPVPGKDHSAHLRGMITGAGSMVAFAEVLEAARLSA